MWRVRPPARPPVQRLATGTGLDVTTVLAANVFLTLPAAALGQVLPPPHS